MLIDITVAFQWLRRSRPRLGIGQLIPIQLFDQCLLVLGLRTLIGASVPLCWFAR